MSPVKMSLRSIPKLLRLTAPHTNEWQSHVRGIQSFLNCGQSRLILKSGRVADCPYLLVGFGTQCNAVAHGDMQLHLVSRTAPIHILFADMAAPYAFEVSALQLRPFFRATELEVIAGTVFNLKVMSLYRIRDCRSVDLA
jgi:hypothetical protein